MRAVLRSSEKTSIVVLCEEHLVRLRPRRRGDGMGRPHSLPNTSRHVRNPTRDPRADRVAEPHPRVKRHPIARLRSNDRLPLRNDVPVTLLSRATPARNAEPHPPAPQAQHRNRPTTSSYAQAQQQATIQSDPYGREPGRPYPADPPTTARPFPKRALSPSAPRRGARHQLNGHSCRWSFSGALSVAGAHAHRPAPDRLADRIRRKPSDRAASQPRAVNRQALRRPSLRCIDDPGRLQRPRCRLIWLSCRTSTARAMATLARPDAVRGIQRLTRELGDQQPGRRTRRRRSASSASRRRRRPAPRAHRRAAPADERREQPVDRRGRQLVLGEASSVRWRRSSSHTPPIAAASTRSAGTRARGLAEQPADLVDRRAPQDQRVAAGGQRRDHAQVTQHPVGAQRADQRPRRGDRPVLPLGPAVGDRLGHVADQPALRLAERVEQAGVAIDVERRRTCGARSPARWQTWCTPIGAPPNSATSSPIAATSRSRWVGAP